LPACRVRFIAPWLTMQSALTKKAIWWVYLPDQKPFTMGGEPMTHQEALETVWTIWATTDKSKIRVE